MNSTVSSTEITKMKTIASQGKFWSELCSICGDWGDMKYSLLFAVPRSTPKRVIEGSEQEIISQYSRRLSHGEDHLAFTLHQIWYLCEMILEGTVPREPLLIELYELRQSTGLDYRLYNAYMDIPQAGRVNIGRSP
jgi:hypothetical protein